MRERERRDNTPRHFLRQLEPSALLIGHTTSFSGSEGAERALDLGGMALVVKPPGGKTKVVAQETRELSSLSCSCSYLSAAKPRKEGRALDRRLVDRLRVLY